MTELSSRLPLVEPESEVHSVESQQSQRDHCCEKIDPGESKTRTEWKDPKDGVIATPLDSSCFQQATNEEKEEDAKDKYDEIFGFDFSSWSGEEQADFQKSVALFREEASKLDAVLAMDKIESLESEIRILRNDLNNRCEKLVEMQDIVHLKDSRISALEMERDLYKADARKLQSDLQSCITKFQALYESSSIPSSGKMEENSQSRPIVRRLDPPSCVGPSTVSQSASSATKTTLSRSSQAMSHISIPSSGASEVSANLQKISTLRQTKRRIFLLCRGSKGDVSKSELNVSREKDSSIDVDVSLEEQVEEMGLRLAASLAAADELRRRIAMLSKHHSCKTNELQLRLKAAEERATIEETHLISPMNQKQEQ